MSIVNEQWHEALGEAVDRIAKTELSLVEKGKAIEYIYLRFVTEDERDSREVFNKQQGETK